MSNLKVIGAGLGRTGTKSLQKALEILGYDPCHHMSVVRQEPDEVIKGYVTLFENDDVALLEKLIDRFSAAVDYPLCLYYKELLGLSPNAKVILSIRDSPEQWEKSVRNTIFPTTPRSVPEKIPEFFKAFRSKLIRRHGFDVFSVETDIKKVYTDWRKEVEEWVKPENLLILNPRDGWEPLCKFLQVPVPEVPYPVSNSTEAFQANLAERVKKA